MSVTSGKFKWETQGHGLFLQRLLPHSPRLVSGANLPAEPSEPPDCAGWGREGQVLSQRGVSVESSPLGSAPGATLDGCAGHTLYNSKGVI